MELSQSRTVTVGLGSRSYEIRIGSESLQGFGAFARASLERTWSGKGCRNALIVTDENVQSRRTPLESELRSVGIEADSAIVPAGESSKSWSRAERLFDRLVTLKADRHTAVVALGGGVVGDLAGFVAALYARGLPLLMIPTTLLAMVDSSVGGKVAINLPQAKNILGSFHQPSGVWIGLESLATLPNREWRCGLAEAVKHGMILDAELFDFLERNADGILSKRTELIQHIVARSCELKAGVVARDEREETGLREVLNFGHTIGHAIEAVAGYSGAFQHGEAVAVGMIAESRLAERLAWIDDRTTSRLRLLLERLGLPTAAPGLDPEAILAAIRLDKKNRFGRVRFVLPRRIGRVESTDAIEPDTVRLIVEEVARS